MSVFVFTWAKLNMEDLANFEAGLMGVVLRDSLLVERSKSICGRIVWLRFEGESRRLAAIFDGDESNNFKSSLGNDCCILARLVRRFKSKSLISLFKFSSFFVQK